MDVQYAEYRVFMISRWPCTALFPEFGGFWNGGSQSHHRFQYEMVWFWMILWYPQFRNLHLWLVGALEHFIFFHILGLIFFRGVETTNQWIYIYIWLDCIQHTGLIRGCLGWLWDEKMLYPSCEDEFTRPVDVKQPNLGTRPYSLPIFNYRYLISKCIKHIPSGELT